MKPRAYAHISPVFNASWFYRVTEPLNKMAELKLLEPMFDHGTMDITNDERIAMMQTADILMHHNSRARGIAEYARAFKKYPWYQWDGEWKTRPNVVMDIDDDIWRVSPFNDAYRYLGICMEDEGSVRWLQPGDKISQRQENGDIIEQWADGKDGFNITENIVRLRGMTINLEASDLIVVSTPRLKEAILREIPHAKNIYISPNCPDIRHFPQDLELGEHPNEVRIMWQGSPTHLECWEPLIPKLAALAKKYPQTTWWFWGGVWEWDAWKRIVEQLPAERVKLMPWTPYEEFKIRMSVANHDIALAPLYPSVFNDSRSAIKWYESSIVQKPAITVAQKHGAYRDEMEDGVTGLLFETPDEFEAKLSEAIEDAALRKRVAQNAKDWVLTNRDPFKHAEALFGQFTALREERALAPRPEPVNEPVPANNADLRDGENESNRASE